MLDPRISPRPASSSPRAGRGLTSRVRSPRP